MDDQTLARLTERAQALTMKYLGGYPNLAADAAQEAVYAYLRERPTFDTPTHAGRWFARVAKCRAVDLLRRARLQTRRRFRMAQEVPLEGCSTMPVHEDAVDLRDAVRKAVERIPARHRWTVEAHYVEGRSCREIAEALGVTRTTIKMRLHRARTLLRQRLEGLGWEDA
jgi:RNA polymerase sigma-70 factor (ECF subfamily)